MSHRYLYNNYLNLIPHDALTPENQDVGTISPGWPQVQGNIGRVIFSGAYTGALERPVFAVEITTAGSATTAEYRWRDHPDSGWTSGVDATESEELLQDGVSVKFDGDVANAFAAGDKWRAIGSNKYGIESLRDMDPNTRFRSGTAYGGSFTLHIDFGAAVAVPAVSLLDNSIPSNAVVTLAAGAALNSTTFNMVIPDTGPNMIFYTETDTAYRYWRLTINPTGNPALQIGNLFFGDYFSPSIQESFPFTYRVEVDEDIIRREAGGDWPIVNRRARDFELNYENIGEADRAGFQTMIENIKSVETRRAWPLIVHKDRGIATEEIVLMDWAGGLDASEKNPKLWNVRLSLTERTR